MNSKDFVNRILKAKRSFLNIVTKVIHCTRTEKKEKKSRAKIDSRLSAVIEDVRVREVNHESLIHCGEAGPREAADSSPAAPLTRSGRVYKKLDFHATKRWSIYPRRPVLLYL